MSLLSRAAGPAQWGHTEIQTGPRHPAGGGAAKCEILDASRNPTRLTRPLDFSLRAAGKKVTSPVFARALVASAYAPS
eukprot:4601922-Pyramimonas_sp.AAC.1